MAHAPNPRSAPKPNVLAHNNYRDYAHVVVDESQDVSPMQWRMVGRRGDNHILGAAVIRQDYPEMLNQLLGRPNPKTDDAQQLGARKAVDEYFRDTPRRVAEGSNGYKADMLHGVWAQAPYLHNGSVPTLGQLMCPTTRPVRFLRGNLHYDEALGMAAPGGPCVFGDGGRQGQRRAGLCRG